MLSTHVMFSFANAGFVFFGDSMWYKIGLGLVVITITFATGLWWITSVDQSEQLSIINDLTSQITDQPLASYRVLYKLQLDNSSNNPSIVLVSGELKTDFINSCNGYITNETLNMNIGHDDGSSLQMNDIYSSLESLDGTSLRFLAKSFTNGRMTKEFDGIAIRENDTLKITYDIPSKKTGLIKENPSFPAQHLRQLIKSIKSGQKFFEHRLFDGSSGNESLYAVATINGLSKKTLKRGWSDVSFLEKEISWSMRNSYYDDSLDGIPLSQSSYQLYANGVVGDMTIDYGDFKVNFLLTEIKELPVIDC